MSAIGIFSDKNYSMRLLLCGFEITNCTQIVRWSVVS